MRRMPLLFGNELRNILTLHFKFAVLITQNRCLLFDVLILLFYLKCFPENYMLTKCLGHENLGLFVRVAPKSICRPLI